ncbi:lipopolysaccharide transport periplasmic protein LptA [Pseudooctadecabacter sp.]|uniref:lipopolysaccharide transport periplasmic protein LptA n=1 Tax=Pseudooctadecabacter sp. TaxID=1966338 RepID=UPI0025D7E0E2|nr:lipopolysaccharide transport periplasmic protein LptA [Pseudooctadecabacter sp.]
MTLLKSALFVATMILAAPLAAQTNLNLGGISADPAAPVEITADNLTVDQNSGTAIFEGNVVLGQGQLRLSAGRVEVIYDGTAGDISRLSATGGVTFVTDTEAAEAQSADYNLDAGTLTMNGDVLLTQGASAISADTMRINLTTGAAQMEGRVRTILTQGGN